MVGAGWAGSVCFTAEYELQAEIQLDITCCLKVLMLCFRYQASKDDLTVYAAISKPPSSDYVNVSRWYNHIDALLRISYVLHSLNCESHILNCYVAYLYDCCCSGVSGEGSGVIVEGSASISEAIATPPATDTKARYNI